MGKSYIIQFIWNGGYVLSLIFIPLIAKDLGASPFLVGMVVGFANFTLFISSNLFGRLSDLYGRKLFIFLGLLSSGIILLFHTNMPNLSTLFVLRGLVGFFIGIIPPVLVSYLYERGGSLGRFTGLGSLGWGVGSIIAGIASSYNKVFLFAAGAFLLSFLISISLKETKPKIKVPPLSWRLIRKNIGVYLSFFLRYTGACAIWAIFPIYLSQLGANRLWIGIIYGLNPFLQFVFMNYLDRYRGTGLISWGLLFSIFTFLLFSISSNYYQLLPIQALLALSWSCLYLGSLKYLMERNIERGTATGIFSSLMGLSGVIGPFLGGFVGTLGYRMVMVFAMVLSILGLIVWRILKRKY